MTKDEKNIENMVNELNNLNESKEFKEWMMLLYKGKRNMPPNIPVTKDNLINGFCWDLAFYLHIKYNVELINMAYIRNDNNKAIAGHYFVHAKNNLYYDGWNTEGVKDPKDLQWCKDTVNSSKIYPHGHIEVFEDDDYSLDPNYVLYKPKLLKILNREK